MYKTKSMVTLKESPIWRKNTLLKLIHGTQLAFLFEYKHLFAVVVFTNFPWDKG